MHVAGMSQLTAPNRSVDVANGVTYAYRRFGNADGAAPPLVFFQHFRGNIDNWDPALVDAVAERREIILFDNAGVGGSTGAVPRTFTEMAHDALAFVDALGLKQIDILGYSIGGYVAQELTLIRPQLVRRIVLAATGPQGGERMHRWTDDIFAHATLDEPGGEDLLALFFERSDTSVANGDNDRMIPTKNTHLLAARLPDARVEIYPDAGHGFLFQYPAEFAADVDEFLA
jgi:pimeloyl-ACP methyl ester carboxylesterase